jgi:hypothetical protein
MSNPDFAKFIGQIWDFEPRLFAESEVKGHPVEEGAQLRAQP